MIEIQEGIREYIFSLGYAPFLVIYTEAEGLSLLKVTFGSNWEYRSFLEKFSVPKKCDKSGIYEFPETLTIIFKGMALKDFLEHVKATI